ncbi:hypothetical protein HK102_011094, partial [Quaeritorhiza haematococci]
ESTECNIDGTCICKQGFAGKTCTECDPLFPGTYPNCTPSILLQNLPVLIGAGSAIGLAVCMFLFMRYQWPNAENGAFLTLLLTIADLASDVLFAVSLFVDTEGLYTPQLVTIGATIVAVPFLIGIFQIGFIIVKELLRNESFKHWASEASGGKVVLSLLAFLGASNPGVLLVSTSKMFGLNVLDAPVSSVFRKSVLRAEILNLVVEDVPQLGLQVYLFMMVGRSKRNFFSMLVLITSGLSLIFGSMGLLIAFFTSSNRNSKPNPNTLPTSRKSKTDYTLRPGLAGQNNLRKADVKGGFANDHG